MNWDDYKFFTAVAQAGSVRAAARALDVNASTVSRRLEQFELRVGVSLFQRTQKGLTLTPDGEAVAEQAARLAGDLADLERTLRGRNQSLTEPIRLEVPDALITSFLMHDLRQLTDAEPELCLSILPPWRNLDVARQEVDVAIRITDAPDLDLVGQPLGRFAVAAYGAGAGGAERWLGWNGDGPMSALSEAVRSASFEELPAGHSAGNVLTQAAAVREGLGTAVLPCAVADADPAFQRVSEPVLGPSLWMLMHRSLRGAERIQRLTAFLREVFAQRVDLLEGRGKMHL